MKPFIVAELSGNHSGDFELAKKMVLAAAKAGASAIKLQTYTADTMTLNLDRADLRINEADSLWSNRRLYDLYAEAATPWEWHQPLFELANSLGLEAFSSPFDESAVEFLETLNVPRYKIASFELTDLPLIRAVAKTGKPVIMSTGMASIEEIKDALNTAKKYGAGSVTLLKCTSTYPASIKDSNLVTLLDMKQRFGCAVGLSDHTRGNASAIAAVALGATFIEKHFVLDRSAGGVDAEFSIEPHELAELVNMCQEAYASLGQVHFGGVDAENAARRYRRSLYFVKDLPAGHIITAQDIKSFRPVSGIEPRHFDAVLGQELVGAVNYGDAVTWDAFK